MTDIKTTPIQRGTLVRMHNHSVPHFLPEVNQTPELLTGITVMFYQPGYLAFRTGVHGGPAWWSETHFEAIQRQPEK